MTYTRKKDDAVPCDNRLRQQLMTMCSTFSHTILSNLCKQPPKNVCSPISSFRVVLQLCAAEFRLCKGRGGEKDRLLLTRRKECSVCTAVISVVVVVVGVVAAGDRAAIRTDVLIVVVHRTCRRDWR